MGGGLELAVDAKDESHGGRSRKMRGTHNDAKRSQEKAERRRIGSRALAIQKDDGWLPPMIRLSERQIERAHIIVMMVNGSMVPC